MTVDIQKLKALAEAASPGPWFALHPNAGQRGSEVAGRDRLNQICGDVGPTNALFIAAANPVAVLELIAEIERLQRFETAYKEYSDKTDWVQENAHWSELGMHRADVLRKRCDDGASQLQAQADHLKRLMAENEALRKDAERYRWLRKCSHFDMPQHQVFCKSYGPALDDDIDAAMSKEASHG